MVWAKKYSISSMSWVATPTRSPRAPPRQIGGRQRSRACGTASMRMSVEQPVRHVVGEPGLEPVQQRPPAAPRRRAPRARAPKGSPRLTARHHQRAQHADADERGHARDAEHEGGGRAGRDSPARCPSRTRTSRGQPGPWARIAPSVPGVGRARRRGRRRRCRRRPRAVVEPSARSPGRAPATPAWPAMSRAVDAGAGPSAPVWVPRLGHAPLVEDEDAVGADHAREPVREDQRGAARA